jgi:DNA-binding IclR family transcriptional regulator
MSIQVIDRVASILDLLTEEGAMGLSDISQSLKLKKTTLVTILQSLVSARLVSKKDNGQYALGERFKDLSLLYFQQNSLEKACLEALKDFTVKTGEHAVASVIRNYQLFFVAQVYMREKVVSQTAESADYTVYETASGRVFLAFMSKEKQNLFIEKHGLPTKEDWPEVTSKAKLFAALEKIKKAKFETHRGIGNNVVIALPVFNQSGNICTSIGATIPACRFNAKYQELIKQELLEAADKITQRLI